MLVNIRKMFSSVVTPSTPRVIMIGGGILVAAATVIGATVYFKRKKKPTVLGDRKPKAWTPRWRWVDNNHFWFDESAREFASIKEFYAEIKHGGDSPQSEALTYKDLKRRNDGVYYKGVKVLAPMAK